MGNKGKKVFRAPRQRAAVLLPRYLVWMKSYLFVYVSLSAVCTPSRRCTTLHRMHRVCAYRPLRSAHAACNASDKQPHVHTTSESESVSQTRHAVCRAPPPTTPSPSSRFFAIHFDRVSTATPESSEQFLWSFYANFFEAFPRHLSRQCARAFCLLFGDCSPGLCEGL